MRETLRKGLPIGVALLVLAVLLGGCASSKPQSGDDGAEQGQSVHVYEASALPEAAYEKTGEVTSVACKKDVYSESPTREEAVSELKRKAGQRSGNALINVVCRRGGNAVDCANGLQCTGDAIRVASVESLPLRVPRGRSNQFGEVEVKSGTGWVLSSELVVTSAGLVRGRSEITISVPDTTLAAQVVARDDVHNLALLRPSRPSLLPPPLPLVADGARTGESVFTVGYPSVRTGGAGVRTSTGIVSAQSGALGDARVYRTTFSSPFERGGAPLLNYRGQVVGMLISSSAPQGFSQTGSAAESVSYAVKNTYLRQLQTRVDARSDSLRTAPGEGQFVREESSLPALLEAVAPSVLRVTAR